MKSLFTKIVIILVIGCSVGLASAVPSASAKDILKDACNSDTLDSSTCQSTTTKDTNPLTGTNGMLHKISTLIAVIAGVVAVIIIIVSGLMYITAGGDAQKITSAKNALIGALVGLIIIVLAQSIITFVVRRL